MPKQSDKMAGQPVQNVDCPACKSRIQGLASYCPYCGAALVQTRSTAAPEHAAAPAQPQVEPPPPPPRPQPKPVQQEPAALREEPAAVAPKSEPPAPVEPDKPPGPWLRRAGIIAAVLIVSGVTYLAMRDRGVPPPEEVVRPAPPTEPDTVPAAPRPIEPGPRPPARPPSPPEPVPEPPRRVAMLDEQRSRQYVRHDLSANVRVRDFPSTADGRVLTSLAPGSEVLVTGHVSGGNWMRVSIAGFGEAYMDGSMLTRDPPQRYPARFAGRVQDMRDTATLTIDGQTVSLFGVAPGTGEPYMTQMQRFIREQGNTVDCAHVEGGRYRCYVQAGDLAELLLINGAGRASPDAPQSYFDNERLAQDNRRGIWAQ